MLFRKLCIEKIRKDYPEIEPRNDYELARLAERQFKGSPAEIYAQLDEDTAMGASAGGFEFLMEAATALLDSYVEPTGVHALTCHSLSRTPLLTLVTGQTWILRLPRQRRQLYIRPPHP